MKSVLLTAQFAAIALFASANSRIVTPEDAYSRIPREVGRRALPANAPHGYTPQTNSCPSNTPSIRTASSLSDQELSWLQVRRNATIDPMRELLSRMNIKGFNTNQYINQHQNNASALPNIGIALSGGGYRAMLNGAGVVEAFDSRTPNSTNTGQLGGLLQASTYLSALSGGNWLVGSLFSNNFTSVSDILAQNTADSSSGNIWQFDNSIFDGPPSNGIQFLSSTEYYADLVSDVHGKSDAGFNTTITDYWGRALSSQLVNADDGGPDYTFSSIADQNWFTSGTTPLPLIVSDGRAPGQVLITGNATVYTFSPWELGSEDPTVYAFAPLKYVGTNFAAGSPTDKKCVTGFDNVGYVMGTSSSLFNAILTTVGAANTTSLFSTALKDALAAILTVVGKANDDIADYPNPFYRYDATHFNPTAPDVQLTLVDGGEDGQNVPLHPLIQPNRRVDVVFAVDSSADTNSTYPTSDSSTNWPLGVSLIATYERSLLPIANGTVFPSIPDVNTFLNLGLNNHPTFFGCDASNLTGPSPLIVYLPNAPYTYNSNISTYDLQFSDDVRNAVVLNGYNLATQANGTMDEQWPACVGCAILSRSLDRTGTTVPNICKQCFDQYCWNGTTDSSTPSAYVPTKGFGKIDLESSSSTSNHKSDAGKTMASLALALASTMITSLTLL